MDLNVKKKLTDVHFDENEQLVSPLGRSFSTTFFSLGVQAIFELEQPVDVPSFKKAIEDILLPRNPRFSCLMIEDKDGVWRWKKTEVDVDDHLFVTEFQPGQDEHDEFVNDYICNIHLTPLPHDRPMWAFHFLNCNTSNARSTLIMNMHHSLGDGTSLMSLVFSCLTRVDNPELSMTFPSSKSLARIITSTPYNSWAALAVLRKMWLLIFNLMLITWYTLCDFISSALRVRWMDDSKLPMRGPAGVVELLPKVMSSVTFSMEDIRKIKNSAGGTVNDVIMGVIFYGVKRYLQITMSDAEKSTKPEEDMATLRVTALATMNTRAMSGLKNLEEMLKPNSGAPWGNHFGLLHIGIPLSNVGNPLYFVRRAKQIIDRKKKSLEVFVTGRLLCFLARFRGPQASAACLYNTVVNTTLSISNMIGPMEKVAMNKIPVKSFFFSISGLPQTLLLTIVSYKGSVRLQVIGVKGYVDADILSRCFGQCFQDILNG